ncbi:hypothetical protein Q7P36_002861 [Cladosporium allicinum]
MTTVDQQYAAAKRTYNTDAPERSSTSLQACRKELSSYAAFNSKRLRRAPNPDDELAKYKGITDPPESQDPLDWWILYQDQYPVLKHLAFNLLAAPASTVADERLFSMTGNVVNEQRPHTQQQIAESVQCLRSWHAEALLHKQPTNRSLKVEVGWLVATLQRIKNTDVLIIDEISMLESNQFRRLDRACRAARQHDRPFGGMQVVVTGDFYQLPPVKPFHTCFDCGVELKTRALCRWCQASPDNDQWPFRSDTWTECDFQCVSLTEVHRQSDTTFVGILNTLRVGNRLDRHQLSLLDGRRSDVGEAIELSPKRDEVELKNRKGFEAIKRPVRAYKCQDYVHIQAHHPDLESKKERDGYGNFVGCQDHRFPPLLETKLGMPVILLANINPKAGLVNGSQGRIVRYEQYEPLMEERQRRLQESGEFGHLEEHEIVSWTEQQVPDFPLPVVEFENGAECPVYPVCQDTELGDPAPFSVVARTQIPLLPAWAITIHKSQGMTLEKVVVNLDHSFEPQMAYVALSRARSLNELKVVSGVGLEVLQERGMLGGGGLAVRTFMQGTFGLQG